MPRPVTIGSANNVWDAGRDAMTMADWTKVQSAGLHREDIGLSKDGNR